LPPNEAAGVIPNGNLTIKKEEKPCENIKVLTCRTSKEPFSVANVLLKRHYPMTQV
jgi:hypothetical protein